nr:aldehyde dehydrogenase family protein [Halorubrum sp. BOL3-1]
MSLLFSSSAVVERDPPHADYDRALGVTERIDAGAVRINGAPSHGLGDIPFGGNGDSGIGREGIDTSIEAYLRIKSIVL